VREGDTWGVPLPERVKRRIPAWRLRHTWVPAPRYVVSPALAGIDPDRLEMPDAFAGLAAPPVFITGSARSGTTFTLDVFAQHPEVCTILESWLLTQTHGLTSIFAQPEWEPRVRENAMERVGQRRAAVQLLSYEEMVRDVGDLIARWLMRPVRTEHRFVVAKEPLDVQAAATLFPEARFIHVIRDGRDVVLSMRRASESWDPSMGVGLPLIWRAEAWRGQVKNARDYRDLLEGRYLEIRFEDMRSDLASAARTLFDFSGIPYADAVLDRIRAGTELSGYSDAVRDSGFRGRGEVGRWRNDFTIRDAISFNRAAGELLVELGYARDLNWWRELLPRPFSPRVT
jgi:Sulfotransferase family